MSRISLSLFLTTNLSVMPKLAKTVIHWCVVGTLELVDKVPMNGFPGKLVVVRVRRRKHRPTGEVIVVRYAALARASERTRQVVEKCSAGYFNYHAVPGNLASLNRFRREVSRRWLRALRRRVRNTRMTWARLSPLLARWLPYPNLRFDAKYLR